MCFWHIISNKVIFSFPKYFRISQLFPMNHDFWFLLWVYPRGCGEVLTSYQISPTPSVYAGYLPPSASDFNKFLPTPSTLESPKLSGLLPFSSLFAYREFSLRARLSSISTKQMLTKQVLTGRLWGRLAAPPSRPLPWLPTLYPWSISFPCTSALSGHHLGSVLVLLLPEQRRPLQGHFLPLNLGSSGR